MSAARRWAKRAGIDGFIVSWKSTPVLNRRLERLAEVADAEHFKLLVIYQGLDFYREPLPAVTCRRATSTLFERRFAQREAFAAFEKPLVIWSGTWRFSRREMAKVTRARRDALLILASERNVDGYRRLAGSVDGNAYYWASVNPTTYPGHAEKLARLGQAVHAQRRHLDPVCGPRLRRPEGGRHERRRAPRRRHAARASSTRPRARRPTPSA